METSCWYCSATLQTGTSKTLRNSLNVSQLVATNRISLFWECHPNFSRKDGLAKETPLCSQEGCVWSERRIWNQERYPRKIYATRPYFSGTVLIFLFFVFLHLPSAGASIRSGCTGPIFCLGYSIRYNS